MRREEIEGANNVSSAYGEGVVDPEADGNAQRHENLIVCNEAPPDLLGRKFAVVERHQC